MWDHTANGFVEDSGRSAEMEGTTTSRVISGHFSKICVVLQFRSEELSRYVKSFASHHDYFLTIEQLFGNSTGQSP